MRNYTKKGTNAENFMQISLLLKKIWYLKDSRNGHFAMHYSSFEETLLKLRTDCGAYFIGDFNISFKQSSHMLESYKHVLGLFNLKADLSSYKPPPYLF